MSSELIKARSKIAGINRYLKQEKILPAIVSMHEAVAIIVRTPLLKHEKEEFARTLDQALYTLNNNEEFKKVCPMVLEYTEGNEKQLLSVLKDLLEDLQGSAVDEAKQMLDAIEEAKRSQLLRGTELLEKGKFKDAKFIFNKLLLQFPDDTDLKYEIAELFLKHERNKDALQLLTEAIKDFPESAHLYNRVGMVLRKMEEFQLSEKYYNKALKLATEDPGLFFNIGRLYIDWKRWDKVNEMASSALDINPDFVEARKMRSFAVKKMKKAAKENDK